MWSIDCLDDTCFVMVPLLVGTIVRGFGTGALLGLVFLLVFHLVSLLISLPVRKWWKGER